MPWEETDTQIRSGHRPDSDFQPGTYKTIWISRSKGIQAVIGRLKGKTTTAVKSYIFLKSKGWTMERAKAWFREHQNDAEPSQRHMAVNLMLEDLVETEEEFVIPTIFTREGVQNGGLKLAEELMPAAPTLNGKPVVYFHPPERRPVGEEDYIVGHTSDVVFRPRDKTVWGYTHIDKAKAPPHFVKDIKRRRSREGSVGYWCTDQPARGEYNGVPYTRIERDIVFDHYAVGIPQGACSVSDGCGLFFDQAACSSCACAHHGEGFDMSDPSLEGQDTVCRTKLENTIDWLRNRVEDVAALLTFSVNGPLRFGSSHWQLPKADRDKQWDFRAADYTLEQLRRASTWVAPGEEDNKGGHKLPHHLPNGTIVFRGVSTAIAALNGSRGGVDIPAGDRKPCYNHLARHYRAFGDEPPELRGNIYMDEAEQITKLQEQIDTLRTELQQTKETLEAKEAELTTTKTELQKRLDAEAAALKAERDAIIADIVKVTGEEAKLYEGWEKPQLEKLKAAVVSSTDRTALMPRAGLPTGKPGEQTKRPDLQPTVGDLTGEPLEQRPPNRGTGIVGKRTES